MKNHQWTIMNQYSPRIDPILTQPLKIPSNCTMFFFYLNPWPEVSRSVVNCEGPIPLPLAFATAWTSRCGCGTEVVNSHREDQAFVDHFTKARVSHISHMGMDQYLLIPFLGEWTSIYQLFWCELQGYKVLTHAIYVCWSVITVTSLESRTPTDMISSAFQATFGTDLHFP